MLYTVILIYMSTTFTRYILLFMAQQSLILASAVSYYADYFTLQMVHFRPVGALSRRRRALVYLQCMPVTSDSRRDGHTQWTSVSAAVEKRSNAEAVEGTGGASFRPSRLTQMMHVDVSDGSPDPGRARPTRFFAAPTAHGRAHLSYPLL